MRQAVRQDTLLIWGMWEPLRAPGPPHTKRLPSPAPGPRASAPPSRRSHGEDYQVRQAAEGGCIRAHKHESIATKQAGTTSSTSANNRTHISCTRFVPALHPHTDAQRHRTTGFRDRSATDIRPTRRKQLAVRPTTLLLGRPLALLPAVPPATDCAAPAGATPSAPARSPPLPPKCLYSPLHTPAGKLSTCPISVTGMPPLE